MPQTRQGCLEWSTRNDDESSASSSIVELRLGTTWDLNFEVYIKGYSVSWQPCDNQYYSRDFHKWLCMHAMDVAKSPSEAHSIL